MKKKICFSVAILLVAVSGLGWAAPSHMEEGRFTVGFSHSFLNGTVGNGSSESTLGRELTKGLFGEVRVSDRLGLTLERSTYGRTTSNASADAKYFDVRAGYKLSGQMSLVLGSRRYDTVSSSGGVTDSVKATKTLYGLTLRERLGKNWQGNLSFMKSALSSELKAGADYRLSHNMTLGLNYKDYKETGPANTLKLNGFELTMSHRF